ncbi:MAG: methyltransferase domain-containing protein [Candidatus Latescibacteria bacterium]|nr:methyltransferase domain-containing protein [Candidatus Latescibacterota bacterium]
MMFDEMADNYDRWYETPVGAAVDRMEKRAFLKVLEPKVGERLLEVGSGTGHWSLWFRSLGLKVTGLEIAPNMVAVAQDKMGASRRNEGAQFLRGDGCKLPFRNGSFDITTAVTALEFIPEMLMALDEMWRCTRAGGRMVVGVLNRRSFFARQRRREAETRKTVFSEAHFFERRELKELLGRYGNARVVTSTYLYPSALGVKFGTVFEVLGRIFFRRGGAFLVGRVDKEAIGSGEQRNRETGKQGKNGC